MPFGGIPVGLRFLTMCGHTVCPVQGESHSTGSTASELCMRETSMHHCAALPMIPTSLTGEVRISSPPTLCGVNMHRHHHPTPEKGHNHYLFLVSLQGLLPPLWNALEINLARENTMGIPVKDPVSITPQVNRQATHTPVQHLGERLPPPLRPKDLSDAKSKDRVESMNAASLECRKATGPPSVQNPSSIAFLSNISFSCLIIWPHPAQSSLRR